MKLLFLVVVRIFPNFRPGLWKAGCDVVRLYVLQSYRSCIFCKRKTRSETQFWIELAAPCTHHNEINSDDTLPFIIFLTLVSCDGSNSLWRQHLLLSPCPLCCHKQTLFGVIRPLTGGKCRTFRRVIERFCFHRYLCFHCIFCVCFFVYCFFTNRVTISYLNFIHYNSTLNLIKIWSLLHGTLLLILLSYQYFGQIPDGLNYLSHNVKRNVTLTCYLYCYRLFFCYVVQ